MSRACDDCHLAGGCCFEARPPLSQKRIDILMENGVSADAIEFVGYKRLRLRQDGFCVLFRDGKCSIHDIKPETCVAGPFTFDIEDDMLQIFLKRESICPMVRFLRANRKAYDALFETSVEKIMDLIRSVPEEEMAQILQIDEPQTDLVAEIRLED
ncbi:MAG TPA: YkgJ family cysteine cluster protein [Methanothrix soehngenii]|nr:YkgJ family cysteine cluster protein [Methanothrix soehngenii]